ncbi:hypothetical protein J6590_052336 [Homalodisca vitripennis]|nr:hypothetical protein J6590_052336 [Homalodisca vitripennis]
MTYRFDIFRLGSGFSQRKRPLQKETWQVESGVAGLVTTLAARSIGQKGPGSRRCAKVPPSLRLVCQNHFLPAGHNDVLLAT